jgi:hypothetical protein
MRMKNAALEKSIEILQVHRSRIVGFFLRKVSAENTPVMG